MNPKDPSVADDTQNKKGEIVGTKVGNEFKIKWVLSKKDTVQNPIPKGFSGMWKNESRAYRMCTVKTTCLPPRSGGRHARHKWKQNRSRARNHYCIWALIISTFQRKNNVYLLRDRAMKSADCMYMVECHDGEWHAPMSVAGVFRVEKNRNQATGWTFSGTGTMSPSFRLKKIKHKKEEKLYVFTSLKKEIIFLWGLSHAGVLYA